jgi:hypothetical protein
MIQTDPENVEQLRDKLRKMTDLELRKYGRFASLMSDPKKNVGPPNPAFGIQLTEARTEWRRRHPQVKSKDTFPRLSSK